MCRKPSESSKRRESVKKEISKIHEESHEIYGAPKITEELKKAMFHDEKEKRACDIGENSRKLYA